jgi:hypothetical protein
MGNLCCQDMAIGLVIFNPAKSIKIIENYYEMIKQFEKFNLPFYTLELVYDGKPQICEAYHIYGKSVMFHKENLCRILETKIPPKYKKIVFLDADIIFDRSDWYLKTSIALDYFNIVQPFEKCYWLDSKKRIMLERETVLKMTSKKWDYNYHPGFAWAFQREWYKKIGFFDYAVTGSGDTLSAIKWLNKEVPKNYTSLPYPLKNEFSKFCLEKPTISFIPGIVRHLFHGSLKNRKYVERHEILNVKEDILDLIYKNSENLFQWKNPEMSIKLKNYFISRNDDDKDTIVTS